MKIWDQILKLSVSENILCITWAWPLYALFIQLFFYLCIICFLKAIGSMGQVWACEVCVLLVVQCSAGTQCTPLVVRFSIEYLCTSVGSDIMTGTVFPFVFRYILYLHKYSPVGPQSARHYIKLIFRILIVTYYYFLRNSTTASTTVMHNSTPSTTPTMIPVNRICETNLSTCNNASFGTEATSTQI